MYKRRARRDVVNVVYSGVVVVVVGFTFAIHSHSQSSRDSRRVLGAAQPARHVEPSLYSVGPTHFDRGGFAESRGRAPISKRILFHLTPSDRVCVCVCVCLCMHFRCTFPVFVVDEISHDHLCRRVCSAAPDRDPCYVLVNK